MEVRAVILAAGKGTRLHSEEYRLPKVMREVKGKPLLQYVLGALSFLPRENVLLVVGYMSEAVVEAFPQYSFAVQKEQLGTGHAVMTAAPMFEGYDGTILVCYGDMPLLKQDTYSALLRSHKEQGNACTLLTGTSDTPLAYGRVLRDSGGSFLRVIEDRDCTQEEKKIEELNVGIYAFDAQALLTSLGELRSDGNSQREYYLTDVPGIIRDHGGKIGLHCQELNEQILGVNTREDLRLVESYMDRA